MALIILLQLSKINPPAAKLEEYQELKTHTLIRSIPDIIISRNARGSTEIEYGDLFLSRIETGTQDSSFDMPSIELRIQEHSLFV